MTVFVNVRFPTGRVPPTAEAATGARIQARSRQGSRPSCRSPGRSWVRGFSWRVKSCKAAPTPRGCLYPWTPRGTHTIDRGCVRSDEAVSWRLERERAPAVKSGARRLIVDSSFDYESPIVGGSRKGMFGRMFESHSSTGKLTTMAAVGLVELHRHPPDSAVPDHHSMASSPAALDELHRQAPLSVYRRPRIGGVVADHANRPSKNRRCTVNCAAFTRVCVTAA